ncbi:MAG TPA: methyltransferase domain-containing protein [Terriglobia bacterium]|nr:methyltransferase domain-containing protein [Terriglobia bacterium]
MREEDFESLYQLEENYWWFAAMRRVTGALVGDVLQSGRLRILDAGCGVGYNLLNYQRQGHEVFGFDLAPEALDRARRWGVTEIAEASVTEIPFVSNAFDLVFSFDVLEQLPVAAGSRAVAEMSRVLRPGGTLFIRTPAFEWLRSSHDEELKSVHRFTAAELGGMAEAAGLEVRWSAYANMFLFPVALVTRMLKRVGIGGGSDVRPLPRALEWINPIFREILASEASLIRRNVRAPLGLSAICVARKP